MPKGRKLSDSSPLASLLDHYMTERGFSQAELSKRSRVAKATINRWIHGASVHPYYREGLLNVAAVLNLHRVEADRLLQAAGLGTLEGIARTAEPGELKLLSRWTFPVVNNLPADLTSFVGRELERWDVAELLCDADVRLVTLTGPGGSGKTRLALRLARDVLDVFPDGVFFVPLAAVTNPSLVMQTIADTIGLRDVPDVSLSARLSAWLKSRRVLLVLDNLERLIEAGPGLVELLSDAAHLKILATSRVPLHLTGEHERPVPPLPLPSCQQSAPEVWENAAVELFVQRAHAANPRRVLVERDAATIGEICTRLDGLPLAIELAAARVRDYELATLLADFPNRLDLSVGGPVDVAPRQRTLRQTIAWSFDLLSESDRELFVRLSVFVGGWTTAAAAAVCFAEATPIAAITEQLSRLEEASLIERTSVSNGVTRYRMLETIREYALEQCRESPGEAALRDRHASHFLSLLESAPPYVPEQRVGGFYERVDTELDNIRAALDWLETTDDLAHFARLCAALWPYWYEYLRAKEGWARMQHILPRRAEFAPALRARVTIGASYLAFSCFLFDEARALGIEALNLAREVDDHRGIALICRQLGWGGYMGGASDSSIGFLSTAVEEWRQAQDTHGIALALTDMASAYCVLGEIDKAVPHLDEAEALGSCMQDEFLVARQRRDRGLYALLRGDFAQAIDVLKKAVQGLRAANRSYLITGATFYLATAYCFTGNLSEALRWYSEALELPNTADDKVHLALTLLGFAAVAARQGDMARAAILSGASLAVQQANQIVFPAAVQQIYDREIAQVRTSLDDAALYDAFARGSQMTTDEMFAFARAGVVER